MSGQNSRADPEIYTGRNAELIDFLAMLYFIVEVFRTDETFGDELSMSRSFSNADMVVAMDPPLPIILFRMVAGLKDKLPVGYPAKRVG